jgi:hypothetical protein
MLTKALSEGHTVLLSLAAPPRVNLVPPLVTACRLRFSLTLAEAAVFVELLERGQVEQEPLQDAMSRSGNRGTAASLRVLITKVRRKMAVHDIAIGLLWGQGYSLAEENRVRARKLLTESATAPQAEPAPASPD